MWKDRGTPPRRVAYQGHDPMFSVGRVSLSGVWRRHKLSQSERAGCPSPPSGGLSRLTASVTASVTPSVFTTIGARLDRKK